MSGGHFDYQETYLRYIAEQLQTDINEANHNEETIYFLRRMIIDLLALKFLLHKYDYAMEADATLEEFIRAARIHYHPEDNP